MLEQRVIEWRDVWVAEGKAEGRAEGKAEGRLAGEAEVLSRQLEKKFGALPDWARDRFAGADAEQLLDWAERLLSAESLEAVFD